MCGINGILRLSPGGAPVDRGELLRTRDTMTSRGPDGFGAWIADDHRVGLGHRRLAIIDLSEDGLQPMSRDGDRFRIVFNGEIFNYRELRRELSAQGVVLRTKTDTEVILALYAREGPRSFRRLRGMYAFAIWDAAEQTLLLARDPYGIKPLYYTVERGCLRFASQVKALEAGGAVSLEVDPAGLVGFLLWGSVPEPLTLRRAIRSLPAGHFLIVREGRVEGAQPHQRFDEGVSGGASDLRAALEESVRAHLVADVPVAVFLSAGLDSSMIAALASRELAEPLLTLTLRFDEYENSPRDEAPLAAEVARVLGTRHVERRVRREEFLDLWPAAIAAMDQPSIDGFNTFVVSRVAREQGLKVVLSGLGGDELAGSYPSFRDIPRWSGWAARLARLPRARSWWPELAARLKPDKPKLAGLVEHGASLSGAYFLRRGMFLPAELPPLLGERIAREGLAAYDPVADAARCLGDVGRAGRPADATRRAWEAVHVMESTQYMRNQLLRDADWASMAHSVELRVPFVDVGLRAAAAAAGYEPARSRGKAALVRWIAPELPEAIWSRPKSGFSIPVMEWLDDAIGIDASAGLASRQLAFEVLKAFDVDLGTPPGRRAGAA